MIDQDHNITMDPMKEEAITKTEETRHQDHTVKTKEECQDLEEDPTSDAYYVT